MKHSIKRQMMATFVGIIVFLLAMLIIINVGFLEPYYINNKESVFINLYTQIKTAAESQLLEDDFTINDIRYQAEKRNIDYLIEPGNDFGGYISNASQDSLGSLKITLEGYGLNKKQFESDSKLLEATENYEIYKSKDNENQMFYVEMYGELPGNLRFILRSPLESIHESAAISNKFLLQIGGLVVLLCMVMVYYFAARLTDPILELAEISAKMADLDFDAKYTGGGKDEISILGENFNRMSERLEATIQKLKGANHDLQKDIEQKVKLEQVRNDFISNVSHELKTPIALIQGYAEGLKDGINEDPESMEFYCDVIIDEAQKMNKMVKNLLTLNQLEYGDSDMVWERFDLTELVKGVVGSVEIMIKQAGANVQVDAPESISVWADEFKVEQVVRNYVSNALNHLAGDKVIDIKVNKVGDNKVRVSVFNTGEPIPDEDIQRIWDKFYKVDKAHTREYGGNGIGLSIVKAIMESLHQDFGVKNYDNGVEFWFELGTK
jgi:signal transduction histidine kinase